MRFLRLLTTSLLAPITCLAAPLVSDDDLVLRDDLIYKRENLCSLKSPPQLCQPNSSVTPEETALRAYKFYRAFVVDGDPRTMFSLIDSSYIQHHAGYQSGPQAIWSLFCNGNKIGSEASTAWCFVPSTNMSYARYSTTDRWRWVDGCVHEHWDSNERIPTTGCAKLPTATAAPKL
ncbi:hypothetical protein B0H66DRAFT_639043 [Apodospora peruviana]|uniref:Secreted protein n=1 Tax=Apodospora peruviana TaxID=516989 RepID=A0AAE0IDC0_9PEZI|nr:hypothetical protein B0H66DRAFT_639043 [Apodospora peruviana]